MTLRIVIILLELLCISLAILLVYMFVKMYNTKGSTFLLGLPVGFACLLTSYILLELHMINLTFNGISDFSSILMWVRAIAQLIGFTSIAMSYFVAGRYQGTSKRGYSIISLGTAFLILVVFLFLFMFFEPLKLESVYSSISIFTVVNLALISYIILFLYRKIQLAKNRFKDLLNTPLAFFFLWLGQFSFLFWSVANHSVIFLIGSQVTRIVGLALFVQIYYSARKESSTDASE